jgi:hypothetical protein
VNLFIRAVLFPLALLALLGVLIAFGLAALTLMAAHSVRALWVWWQCRQAPSPVVDVDDAQLAADVEEFLHRLFHETPTSSEES